MYRVSLPYQSDESGPFRQAVRSLITADIAPEQVVFEDASEPGLFESLPVAEAASPFTVPRDFITLMDDVLCHCAEDRFALLYDVLWRMRHGDERLLERLTDAAVNMLNLYARAVRRDIHKMHAFVRFRPRMIDGNELNVAWFEPQHSILRRAVPFFVERFATMAWMIATPVGSALWQDGELHFGEAATRPEPAPDNVLDELWLTYFRTIFNPARLHINAMLREMPKHYWHNMPESALIPEMIAAAGERTTTMINAHPDHPPVHAERIAKRREADAAITPDSETLEGVRKAAETCTRCPLYKNATQTVFGEGPTIADVMFVGEQPGDKEDLRGRPFVGPAGEMFNAALIEAGIDRARVYVTNAVKHFKFEPRGKRRIHQRPNAGEIQACRWWLDQEIALVNPKIIVALGATAAQSLSGKSVAVTKMRGHWIEFRGRPGTITVHPSYLLRIPAEIDAARERALFVSDLKAIAAKLEKQKAA